MNLSLIIKHMKNEVDQMIHNPKLHGEMAIKKYTLPRIPTKPELVSLTETMNKMNELEGLMVGMGFEDPMKILSSKTTELNLYFHLAYSKENQEKFKNQMQQIQYQTTLAIMDMNCVISGAACEEKVHKLIQRLCEDFLKSPEYPLSKDIKFKLTKEEVGSIDDVFMASFCKNLSSVLKFSRAYVNKEEMYMIIDGVFIVV